ncbi:MAG: oxidoreductase [Candidatus Eremiobacteraeota bacterium]|nr:oxidoreductase [Candidatus Eremiobacteraeota bacterium]
MCELLAKDGYHVAVADRDLAAAEAVAHHIDGLAFHVDVSDEASVVALFERACEAFDGTLDALATSAGICDVTPFMEIDLATFRRIHDVNVIGTFLCIREAAKRMRPGGRICTVASIAGKRGGGLSGTAAYAATKGAVLALSRNAARVLSERGIAVNCVAPGATLTPMTDSAFADADRKARIAAGILLRRAAEPSEIAEAIAWLLSPRSSYVQGETLTVDGGVMFD